MTNADVALIEYDVAEDIILKGDDGFCKKIINHDPGLLIVRIGPNAVFNGYTDAQATEKKIVRDVFEEGDAWFNTGDLIKTVDVGYALGKIHYQFVDRVGDTFRWKSENVSTNEVGEILNGFKDVNMSNVYGVKIPGCEGRAGMAAFSLDDAEQFDWQAFSNYVETSLPKYARPLFIRIIQEMDTTGTFKLKKNELRDDAFNINKVEDKVFCLKPSSNIYERLDGNWLDKIKKTKEYLDLVETTYVMGLDATDVIVSSDFESKPTLWYDVRECFLTFNSKLVYNAEKLNWPSSDGVGTNILEDGMNGNLIKKLPPDLRRAGRDVLNDIRRRVPIGPITGGRAFPPFRIPPLNI